MLKCSTQFFLIPYLIKRGHHEENNTIALHFETIKSLIKPTKELFCICLPYFIISEIDLNDLGNYYDLDLILFFILSCARKEINHWEKSKVFNRISDSQSIYVLSLN